MAQVSKHPPQTVPKLTTKQLAERKRVERVTKFPLLGANDFIPLWLAAGRGMRGVPKQAARKAYFNSTAVDPHNFYYDGTKLFRGALLVAEQLTHKGKPYIQIYRIYDREMTRAIAGGTSKNGPVVWAQYEGLTPARVARAVSSIAVTYPAVHADTTKEQRKLHDMATDKFVRSRIIYNTPEAIAVRATRDRLADVLNQANCKVYDLKYAAATPEEIMQHLGYTPQPGDMFKRLRRSPLLGYRSHSSGFVYPPLGEWAPAVEGEVALCHNGYHLTDLQHIQRWSSRGDELFLAEGTTATGDVVRDDEKTAHRSVRLVKYLGDANIAQEEIWKLRKGNLKFLGKEQAKAQRAYDKFVKANKKYLQG